MCGIAGYFNLTTAEECDPAVLRRMTHTLSHRGPDSCGYFEAPGIGLGFRRLSIIDLASGDQPMFNEDRSVVTLCNGELYEYKEIRRRLVEKGHVFHTASDAEILPHLYEERRLDFLPDLNGQFAMAIFDARARRLFLARDHFGINPLYYTVVGDTVVFGSEIKAILEHPHVPRRVDLIGLDQILCFPGLVSPFTAFAGIRSVPSGHYIGASREGVRDREFWDLEYPPARDHTPEPEAAYRERLQSLLLQSVGERLQADVPIGLYLSGGLDSSLVSALTTAVKPNLRPQTYSISFGGRDACEGRYQRIMAATLDAAHHDISFTLDMLVVRLAAVVRYAECPIKDTYDTASLVLSETARRTGSRVVLTGQGADELFAGYIGYRVDQFRARRPVDEDAGELRLREQMFGEAAMPYEGRYQALRRTKASLFSEAVAEELTRGDSFDALPINKDRIRGRHPVHQRSYLDFKLRLVDHLLAEHGDRMAMANGVEPRHPFLHLRIADFCARLPPAFMVKELEEKYILRQMARSFVPPEVLAREKFGWFTPASPELVRLRHPLIEELLSPARVRKEGYFNVDTVHRLKQQYSRPDFELDRPFETDLLAIVITFGLFRELFNLPCLN